MLLDIEEIKVKMADRNASAVANSVGVTRQSISAILTGKHNPSYELLKKLTEYFSK